MEYIRDKVMRIDDKFDTPFHYSCQLYPQINKLCVY